MNEQNYNLETIVAIAQKAGDKIMEIYGSSDFGVEIKSDESPLTKADLAANKIITTELKKISKLDILSEEGNHETASYKFWLVDPLDGTKEFIKRNGEFTVNIALIERGKPILGVVSAPSKNVLYAAHEKEGAYKIIDGQMNVIEAKFDDTLVPVVIASRSHRNNRLEEFLKKIGEHREVSMGSSLKLCLVAEGKAQFYPRLAPTMIWDTAAADAIIRIAGGKVQNLKGEDLSYFPQKDLKNPFFVARVSNDDIFDEHRSQLAAVDF